MITLISLLSAVIIKSGISEIGWTDYFVLIGGVLIAFGTDIGILRKLWKD